MSDQQNNKVKELLRGLSDPEKELMKRVLQIERDWLWSERPRVKEDLLKAVREVIK